ncbi:MAG: hypothetical protein LH624_03900 [Cryobacterium sp.]|nr:hypothetical protein [Cryobacterium sp.]
MAGSANVDGRGDEMALFKKRVKWVTLEVPEISEILIPDLALMVNETEQVSGIMRDCTSLARQDVVAKQTAGLAATLQEAFTMPRYRPEETATLGRMIDSATRLGVALAVLEMDRYDPPENGTHPVAYTALAADGLGPSKRGLADAN